MALPERLEKWCLGPWWERERFLSSLGRGTYDYGICDIRHDALSPGEINQAWFLRASEQSEVNRARAASFAERWKQKEALDAPEE